jgi:hypothetical protein
MAGEGFDHITGTNFFENFPNHNVTALFPELNIGEDGYPHLNKEEILKAYDMNKYNYIDFDFGNGNIMAEFFDRNPYFDLIKYSDFFVEFKVNKQSVPEKLSTIATYGKKATLKDTEVKSIISGELPDIQNSFNNHTLDIFEENENNIQNEINNNDITNHGNVENQEQNIKYENNVIETKQRNKSELSEIEKRKLRAKRFGLPESNVKLSDKEKIEQRRKRFGLTAKEGNKDKKKIDIEVIKRRQERFGITKGISKKLSNAIEEEKRKARQRRFNNNNTNIKA